MRKSANGGLPHQDPDPIRRTFKEASSFDRAWLTGGRRLTTIQRIGFFLFSVLMLLVGATFAGAAITQFMGGNAFVISALFPLGLGIMAFYLGVRRLWRLTKDIFFFHPVDGPE